MDTWCDDSVWNSLACPIYGRAKDGRIVFANAAFKRTFTAKDDKIPSSFNELEDTDFRSGRVPGTYAMRTRCQDGLTRDFLAYPGRVKGDHPANLDIIVVLADVTRENQALGAAQAERETLRNNCVDLENQVKNLQEGALEDLIGSTARTQTLEDSLRAVCSILTSVLTDTEATDDHIILRNKTLIQNALTGMNDVLDVVVSGGQRSVDGRLPLLYIKDVVDRAIAGLSEISIQRNVPIRFEAAPDTPKFIRGDGDVLRLVLRTLLRNAVESSPQQAEVVLSLEPSREFSSWTELRFVVSDKTGGASLTLLQEPDSTDGKSTPMVRLRSLIENLEGHLGVGPVEGCDGPVIWFTVPLTR